MLFIPVYPEGTLDLLQASHTTYPRSRVPPYRRANSNPTSGTDTYNIRGVLADTSELRLIALSCRDTRVSTRNPRWLAEVPVETIWNLRISNEKLTGAIHEEPSAGPASGPNPEAIRPAKRTQVWVMAV